MQQTVLVRIEEAEPMMNFSVSNALLPVRVRFRHGSNNAPSLTLCREVDLTAGASTVIDLPILLNIRIDMATHHGRYGAVIPVSVANIAADGNGDITCPQVGSQVP